MSALAPRNPQRYPDARRVLFRIDGGLLEVHVTPATIAAAKDAGVETLCGDCEAPISECPGHEELPR